MRGLLWIALLALVCSLSGCCGGGGVAGLPNNTPSVTQPVSATRGATLTAGDVSVTIPPNALPQDTVVTVIENPSDLPASAKTGGLVSSVKVLSRDNISPTGAIAITLNLPATRANAYPVYAYKVDSGALTEVDAAQQGNRALLNVTR